MNFQKWMEAKDLPPQIRNKKIVILMRGFPGSGKSYMARALLNRMGGNPEGHILSTDNHWIPDTLARRRAGDFISDEEEKEEYLRNYPVSDESKVRSAHSLTQREFKKKIDQGITPLIVDNTNIKQAYLLPYKEYAEKNGYEVRIAYPDSPWWKELYSHLQKPKNERDQKSLEAALRVLHQRQQHGVPFTTLQKFADEWEN